MTIHETHTYDASTGKVIIKETQDVSKILDANKEAYNSARGFKSEVFNKKADIPNLVWQQWCQKYGIPYQEFLSNPKVLKRFLNDPDNRFCLTRPGKV